MSKAELQPNKYSWSCNVCGNVDIAKVNMDDHIRGTHLGVCTDYNCQICGKPFRSRNSLSAHMSTHHKISLINTVTVSENCRKSTVIYACFMFMHHYT